MTTSKNPAVRDTRIELERDLLSLWILWGGTPEDFAAQLEDFASRARAGKVDRG